ncbi:MAG TPA: hypothetical protein VED40_12015 [Azospirillaceae bacterium]|nr:hypothetical protein [Azospirillaceae bacterium]
MRATRSLLTLSASLMLLAGLGLAPLAVPAAAQQAPGFGFTQGEPIVLDVAEIEVSNDYAPPMKEPNVEHMVPVTPAESVRLWVQDRLKAGGSSGRARVVIRRASVVEVPLERTGGIKGWFTKDQSERYEGRLEVEVHVDQPGRRFNGYTTASVVRTTSVAEDVSVAERERTWLTLVREMAQDLDQQLTAGIKANLSPVMIL